MTVLEADLVENEQRKLGWVIYETEGAPIYPFPEGHADTFRDIDELDTYTVPDRRLTSPESIHPGMKLLIRGLAGWVIGYVDRQEDGTFIARGQTTGMIYQLKFSDKRPAGQPPCWICWGSVNMRGLKKLTL
jgi:hypothetical protein